MSGFIVERRGRYLGRDGAGKRCWVWFRLQASVCRHERIACLLAVLHGGAVWPAR